MRSVRVAIILLLVVVFSNGEDGYSRLCQNDRNLRPRGSSRSPSPEHSERPTSLNLALSLKPPGSSSQSPDLALSLTPPGPLSGHSTQSAHQHPAQGPPAPQASTVDTQITTSRLGRLVAGMDPQSKPSRKPPSHSRRPPIGWSYKGLPGGTSTPLKASKPAGSDKPKGTRTRWWNQVGGLPHRQQTTSPHYEYNKALREKQKLRKTMNKPPGSDEHPSGASQRPPSPPSPGAGSHAVSKRRLWGE